jgi:hypothetical protein
MRTQVLITLTTLLGLAALGMVACGDDGTLGGGTNPPPAGSSGNPGGGTSGGPSTSGGTDNGRPVENVEGDITANRTLDATKNWLLKGLVSVKSGVTLTIDKGTVIKGDNASKAILLVERGAKIVAQGTADEPIVFTSQALEGQKKPGDWGGLIILGNAPVNLPNPSVEGILKAGAGTAAGTTYGGPDPNDSSGVLSYVRVEYSGIVIATDNEVNGITFGGVGKGTKVDHVQVRQTLDDCFEFFGGTVDAKYLACQGNQDDGFDFDNGYTGRLQFLILQQDPNHEGDDNGIESDNDAEGSGNTPLTSPTMYNASLFGKNKSVGGLQYGLLLRKNTRGTYKNLVVHGFQAGLDVRNSIGAGAAGELTMTNSLIWGSTGTSATFIVTDHIAYLEDKLIVPSEVSNPDEQTKYKARPDWNDDSALDEIVWFKTPANANRWVDPQVSAAFNRAAPVFGPATSLTENAVPPPNDGFFDTTATYLGAFKDAADTWATTGKWAVWSEQ